MISKRLILVAVTVAFALATLPFCSDDSEITEVGNPTSTATTTNGTISALSDSVSGLVDTTSLANLVKRTSSREKTETPTSAESCSEEIATRTITCPCPGGGTIVNSFDDLLPEPAVGGQIVFTHTFTQTFNDCVVDACDESITLRGTATGSLEGTFDTTTGSGSLEGEMSTHEPCSGMTAESDTTEGEVPLGFSMTMTFDGTTHDYAGTFCPNNESLSFDDLDELNLLSDPSGTCQ